MQKILIMNYRNIMINDIKEDLQKEKMILRNKDEPINFKALGVALFIKLLAFLL